MALDFLAMLAAASIGLSEALAYSNLQLASFLMGFGIVLLLLAFRAAYFIIAVLLAVLVGCWVLLDRIPAEYRDSSLRGALLGTHAPRWVAGFIHLFGLWLLPVCILWGVLDVYDKDLFFSEELGHQLASMCYMMVFVITPLFLMPAGYEKGELKHQMYESVVMMGAATVYYSVFRFAHFTEGRNPPHLTVPDWDHELVGLFWFFGGALGVVNALAGTKTSAHIVFPAGFVYFSFINHTDIYPDDFSHSEQWLMTWVAPHKIHAICFGAGAVCRLLHRIPESTYFFFVGIAVWCFATKDVALGMWEIFTNEQDGESGWSKECDPDCEVHYHTEHVVRQIVILVGAALYPIHFILLGRLRKFVDHKTGVVEFKSLSMKDDNDMGSFTDTPSKADAAPLLRSEPTILD